MEENNKYRATGKIADEEVKTYLPPVNAHETNVTPPLMAKLNYKLAYEAEREARETAEEQHQKEIDSLKKQLEKESNKRINAERNNIFKHGNDC